MSDEYPIFQSSPKVHQDRRKILKRNFPWDIIDCGQSFTVAKAEIKESNIRSRCSIQNKLSDKKFKMIIHDDCYEIARIK